MKVKAGNQFITNPVMPAMKDGKQGYKWGDKGKVYTGPDAKEKAARQGRAIKAQGG